MLYTCKTVAKIVGHHKQSICLFKLLGRLLFECHELIYSIVELLLDSRACIQLILGNELVDILIDTVRTAVAITYRITDIVTVLINKNVGVFTLLV